MVWINEQHKVIFIHNPKTGGSAIEEAFCGIPGTKKIGGKHMNLTNLSNKFSKHRFNQYQSFAFVRNPWDRVVSLYAFYKAQKRFKESQTPNHDDTFDTWVTRVFYKQPTSHNELCVQCHWTKDVNYVGYFEMLEDEYIRICTSLNIKPLNKLNRVNATEHKPYTKMYNDTTINIVGDYFKRDIDAYGYTFEDNK